MTFELKAVHVDIDLVLENLLVRQGALVFHYLSHSLDWNSLPKNLTRHFSNRFDAQNDLLFSLVTIHDFCYDVNKSFVIDFILNDAFNIAIGVQEPLLFFMDSSHRNFQSLGNNALFFVLNDKQVKNSQFCRWRESLAFPSLVTVVFSIKVFFVFIPWSYYRLKPILFLLVGQFSPLSS
jgi:hypothetical protein